MNENPFRTSWPARLRPGCYFIQYEPLVPDPGVCHYDGTLRVQIDGEKFCASGDLYMHRTNRPIVNTAPVRIPIFPRDEYTFYLWVNEVSEPFPAGGLHLKISSHLFDHDTTTWHEQGVFEARMQWQPAPAGYLSPLDYLEGPVYEAGGILNGKLKMGWVSDHLREAIIEIDKVKEAAVPLDNKSTSPLDWPQVFAKIDWEVSAMVSDKSLHDPLVPWSQDELREAMLRFRDTQKLDEEWRYYLFCVRQIENEGRGIMYDFPGAPPDISIREMAVVAADYTFDKNGMWNSLSGRKLGNTSLYFRTAVHEIGHAMNLDHTALGTGFMTPTDLIPPQAQEDNPFPSNVTWDFSDADKQRLRHWPDIVVRPGTPITPNNLPAVPVTAFPDGQSDLPQTYVEAAKKITVLAGPQQNFFPLGAPVRLNFYLWNWNKESIEIPSRLSLKSGFVTGSVIGPDGVRRPFSSMARHLDIGAVKPLETRCLASGSVTLLHGPGGALFPLPGRYKVELEILWLPGNQSITAQGHAFVEVDVPSPGDRDPSLLILKTPEVLFPLVFGSSRSAKGNQALEVALRNDRLKPHFAFVEFKRLSREGESKPAYYKAACAWLDAATVFTPDELKDAAGILLEARRKTGPATELTHAARTVARKILGAMVDPSWLDLVREVKHEWLDRLRNRSLNWPMPAPENILELTQTSLEIREILESYAGLFPGDTLSVAYDRLSAAFAKAAERSEGTRKGADQKRAPAKGAAPRAVPGKRLRATLG
ncbi:MAG: hypothetical protein AB1813_23755 [Verrucomicrobiota bacterium]